MGPAAPLTLPWCGAYSWRMEHELGSITAGKCTNVTVLAEDPYAVDPTALAQGVGHAVRGTLVPQGTVTRQRLIRRRT